MDWAEAVNISRILRADPASMLAAAMEGWEHPVTREALALYDIFDLLHAVNSKKTPKPHPGRPGRPTADRKRMGKPAGRSPEHVEAILAANRRGQVPV